VGNLNGGTIGSVESFSVERVGQQVRVLVAEDNPVFQSMLRAMLVRWGYDPVIAQDGIEACKALEAPNAPRLAILDWMMPGLDGVEVCRRVRAACREPYVYILLLTGRTDSQDLVEGMEAGADDYLTKPFVAHELRVRLRAGWRILDLQSELLTAREALRVQATHDNLTGIANRGAILEALHGELARAARERSSVAVLLADIDRFKSINDTSGHQAGDEILREAAQRLRGAVRAYDSVGRYGGEEFLIVLSGCDEADACAQAERIRRAIAHEPFAVRGDRFEVTCSFGVAWRETACPGDADAMIREADLALYAAKARGRNRVENYAGDLVSL
jgi:two-component system cell cycle response regulator